MIYPYRTGSNSCKSLAAALGVKQIKREGSKFKGNQNKLVINWGATVLSEEVEKCKVVNAPTAVAIASNKLTYFNKIKGKVNIPEFTTNKDKAVEWIDEGSVVVVRTTLNGHSAEGLYLMDEENKHDLHLHEQAKMYVKYIPKKEEYRVHVVEGIIIDARRKALKQGVLKKAANWKVRNHANGFIFAKDGFELPEQVKEQAILAVKEVGLNFGAVDIIWNVFREQAYVLEVNTAPGLEGSTVDNYAKAFEVFYENIPEVGKFEATGKSMVQSIIEKDPVIPEWVIAMMEPGPDPEEELLDEEDDEDDF